MLFAMANVLWKASLASSKEQEEGSVGSADQEMVAGPPDVGLLEITKLLTAETKGRKKIALESKSDKEKRMGTSRRVNT